MANRQVLVTVEGSGQFPIDMLRYDALRPASEHDSSIITASFFRRQSGGVRRVKLLGLTATEGRWASFGWKVIETEERR